MKTIFPIHYMSCDEDGGFSFGNMDSGYSATRRYLTRDGKPILPLCGEIHFSRCERKEWKRELLKMKECGLTAVSNYIFWNHHEAKKGKFRWDGNRDIAEFLRLCRAVELQVILRIGPWCHGEVRFGGFPDWLMPIPGKRKDTASYLKYVERFWRALYEQIREFCDGETILGIQLENEYPGKINHIHTLRTLAEKIGFQVPYFTMTAWPTNTPDKMFLPMMGGYPEAPWTQNKKPLPPARRFSICEGRTETEIGEDLNRGKREKVTFEAFPFAGCEVGVGNQVTQHRRPIISDLDGYGVAFAKFASGMNLMGYYMFHGGRNPRGELLQETRRTFYPNNYPIVDYDFQAPISKDGVCRRQGDRLRLLHLFIHTWDSKIACKQTFFPTAGQGLPYSSVRCDGRMNGYLFIGNYERGMDHTEKTFQAELHLGTETVSLPTVLLAEGEMIWIPFRFSVKELFFDYITAQPVAWICCGETIDLYFVRMEKQPVLISVNGEVQCCNEETMPFSNGVCLHFMPLERALSFHLVDGNPAFCNGTMWIENDDVCALLEDGQYIELHEEKHICNVKVPDLCVRLTRIAQTNLPYDSYLYSHGKRGYYRLVLQMDQIRDLDDLILDLKFTGLNLQIFCGHILVDDYFNTSGIYFLHIRHIWEQLSQNKGEILIRTVAATKHGIGNTYCETQILPGMEELELVRIRPVKLQKLHRQKAGINQEDGNEAISISL